MKTGLAARHRHTLPKSTPTQTSIVEGHTHDLGEVLDRFVELEDRVAALEGLIPDAQTPPEPVPPVDPPPVGKTVTISNSDGQAAYLQALKDLTVTRIGLVGEPYRWDKIAIDVDRLASPVTTFGVPGKTKFVGNGGTSEGVFYLGLSKVPKGLAFEDFDIDGVKLSQAGAFEIRSSVGIRIRRVRMINLVRDPQWSDKPGKTWGVYLSGQGAGGAGNHDFIGEDLLVSPLNRRDVGAIQMDSSTARSSDITLRRVTADRCDYAFYGAVPVDRLTLGAWRVLDSSNPNGTAVRFGPYPINGTYDVQLLNGSGRIHNSSTGLMVAV